MPTFGIHRLRGRWAGRIEACPQGLERWRRIVGAQPFAILGNDWSGDLPKGAPFAAPSQSARGGWGGRSLHPRGEAMPQSVLVSVGVATGVCPLDPPLGIM